MRKVVIILFALFVLSSLSAVSLDERLRNIEIGQAKIKTEVRVGFEAVNQRFNDINQRITDLYNVVVALMIGIFGFSAYLAYDRRKLNKTLIEIQQGVYDNKRNHEEQNEKITALVEALKKLAKNNKAVQNLLHKHGLS